MRSPEQKHTVQQGECLVSIAKMYGFEDAGEIYQLQGLSCQGGNLYVGRRYLEDQGVYPVAPAKANKQVPNPLTAPAPNPSNH